MKFMHLSDLHIGKKLHEYSLIEDQKHILSEIISAADTEKPDCILIAGDVYDRTVPSAEAVELFDRFISEIAERKIPVLIISGNHDSPERIAFGSKIMQKSNVYLSPVYNGSIEPVVLRDSFGEVFFYMIPFLRPHNVRRFFPEKDIVSYTDALNAVIDALGADFSKRNVIISHQFVTGAEQSGSEDISVGSLNNIDSSVFDGFDYTALGHIHGSQQMCGGHIRYCGTPMKYSVSEIPHKKSITVVELNEKDNPIIKEIPLVPLRDIIKVTGKFDDLMKHSPCGEFAHVVLTDEFDIPDAMNRLRTNFDHILDIKYDNKRTRSEYTTADLESSEGKTPLELFSELYLKQNNSELCSEQLEFADAIIKEIWEGIPCGL